MSIHPFPKQGILERLEENKGKRTIRHCLSYTGIVFGTSILTLSFEDREEFETGGRSENWSFNCGYNRMILFITRRLHVVVMLNEEFKISVFFLFFFFCFFLVCFLKL